jgi:hypothetical protein
VLWSNAGFGTLRRCKEIEGVDPRLDPTVIPIVQPGDDAPDSPTDITRLERAPPNNGHPRFHTVEDIHNAYKTGALTPSDIVEALLPIIRRDVAQRGPHATAFTESKVELVRQAAAASTARWKAGKPLGILDGVPFAVKDDLDVKGYKTHVGTSRDYTRGKDVETSWCVAKLEAEGAVLVGKLNMHELGAGESCADVFYEGCNVNVGRHDEQQPYMGYSTQRVQQLVLYGRLVRWRRFRREPWHRSLWHRI